MTQRRYQWPRKTMSKTDKAKLDAGAAKIREADKQAKKEKAVTPAKSTRPLADILRDHVIVLPDHIGLTLSDTIPLEEQLRVLDWTTQLSDHVGFMVGDVLNHGQHKWGDKYTAAINQTGRAKSTLKNYAWVARSVPPEKRLASLTFSHYQEIIRLGDQTKVDAVLKEVGAQAEKAMRRQRKNYALKSKR